MGALQSSLTFSSISLNCSVLTAPARTLRFLCRLMSASPSIRSLAVQPALLKSPLLFPSKSASLGGCRRDPLEGKNPGVLGSGLTAFSFSLSSCFSLSDLLPLGTPLASHLSPSETASSLLCQCPPSCSSMLSDLMVAYISAASAWEREFLLLPGCLLTLVFVL